MADPESPSPSHEEVQAYERRVYRRAFFITAIMILPIWSFLARAAWQNPSLSFWLILIGLLFAVLPDSLSLVVGAQQSAALSHRRAAYRTRLRNRWHIHHGYCKIKLRWEYGGRVHYAWFSALGTEYPNGAHVPILIDPEHPGRHVVKHEMGKLLKER